jgi:hypothetical protein
MHQNGHWRFVVDPWNRHGARGCRLAATDRLVYSIKIGSRVDMSGYQHAWPCISNSHPLFGARAASRVSAIASCEVVELALSHMRLIMRGHVSHHRVCPQGTHNGTFCAERGSWREFFVERRPPCMITDKAWSRIVPTRA